MAERPLFWRAAHVKRWNVYFSEANSLWKRSTCKIGR